MRLTPTALINSFMIFFKTCLTCNTFSVWPSQCLDAINRINKKKKQTNLWTERPSYLKLLLQLRHSSLQNPPVLVQKGAVQTRGGTEEEKERREEWTPVKQCSMQGPTSSASSSNFQFEHQVTLSIHINGTSWPKFWLGIISISPWAVWEVWAELSWSDDAQRLQPVASFHLKRGGLLTGSSSLSQKQNFSTFSDR